MGGNFSSTLSKPGWRHRSFSGRRDSLPLRPVPNHALEPTPNSVRSCVAPAIGRSSPPALGFHNTMHESTALDYNAT